jgi:PAS domain S-box-containing protein
MADAQPGPDAIEERAAALERMLARQARVLRRLRREHEEVRALLGSVRDIAFRYDTASRQFTYVSPACRAILGYGPEQIVGMRPHELIQHVHPDDSAHLEESDSRLMDLPPGTDTPDYNVEFRVRRQDGDYVWLSVNRSVVPGIDGGPAAIVGTARDVTQIREATEALRESESRYRLLVEGAGEPIFIVDVDGVFHMLNGTAAAMLGGTAEQFVGHTMWELFPTRIAELQMSNIMKAVECRRICTFESMSVVRGEQRYFVAHIQPVIEPDGSVRRVQVIAHDITDRHEVEDALRESEERFRLVFHESPIGMALISPRLRTLRVNPALCQMLGYSEDELCQMSQEDFTHPEDAPRSTAWARRLLSGDVRSFAMEQRCMTKGGAVLWTQLTAALIPRPDGEPLYLLGMLQDITQRKQTEGQLLRYQDRLRSMASQLSVVEERERRRIADDLHDHVGQLLTVAAMHLGALQQTAEGADQTQKLAAARTVIDSAIQATQSLTFELSPPVLQQLGLGPTLEWLAEQVEDQHGLDVGVKVSAGEPEVGDDMAALLFRSTRELLHNVVKHAGATFAEVDMDSEDGMLRITVRDDGKGFEYPATDTDLRHGSGFGLFSVRERLERLGGHLDIRSRPEGGTSAVISVPTELRAPGHDAEEGEA